MFGGLANLVKKDAKKEAPKPVPKSTTTSLLAAALESRGLNAVDGAEKNQEPEQSTAAAAAAGEKRKREEEPVVEGETVASEPEVSTPQIPTKGEYEAQQAAKLVDLDGTIKKQLKIAMTMTPEVVKGEHSSAVAGGLMDRRYVLTWLQLLSAVWEKQMTTLPYEVRHHGPGRRQASDCQRYLAHLAPVSEGLLNDVVAAEAHQADPNVPAPEAYNVPPEIAGNLRDVFVAVSRGKFLAAEEAFMRITMGSAAWHLGLFSGGNIHMRRALDKVQKSAVKHVMNNSTAKDFLLSARMLTGVAEKYKVELGLPFATE